MYSSEFFQSDLFIYFLLPLIIFMARITDVSIGTIRIILVSRGNRILAPLLGFFEVLVWVFAISNIIQHLNNIYAYLAYAGGFATGNYIGLIIEEKLAMGINLIRIFSRNNEYEIMNELHKERYGATVVKARGKDDEVNIIYTIVKRREVKHIIEIIEKYNPHSFYTIEDIKYISHEDFSGAVRHHNLVDSIFRRWRLGK